MVSIWRKRPLARGTSIGALKSSLKTNPSVKTRTLKSAGFFLFEGKKRRRAVKIGKGVHIERRRGVVRGVVCVCVCVIYACYLRPLLVLFMRPLETLIGKGFQSVHICGVVRVQ